MSYGKTVELFFENGTEGLITAILSNWDGFAIKIPRLEVVTCNLKELDQTGVYFLFSKDDEKGEDSVYIGESEIVKNRLLQHLRDYQSGKEKYYWTKAVVFTGQKLHKSTILCLENKFVCIARDCNRYKVLTKNTHSISNISRSLDANTNEFIDNAKIIMSSLGYKVLEPVRRLAVNFSSSNNKSEIVFILEQKVRGYGKVKASGTRTSEGFVVLKDSRVSLQDTSNQPVLAALKKKAIIDGDIDENGILKKDMLFSSPSYAASFVVGSSSNGPKKWRDYTGRTLKEVEYEEIL